MTKPTAESLALGLRAGKWITQGTIWATDNAQSPSYARSTDMTKETGTLSSQRPARSDQLRAKRVASDGQQRCRLRVVLGSLQGHSARPVDVKLTVELRKIDGVWMVTHEHHSVASDDQRFVASTT